MMKRERERDTTVENPIIYNYACYWWDRQSMSMLQIISTHSNLHASENEIKLRKADTNVKQKKKCQRRRWEWMVILSLLFDMWCACETYSSSMMLHKKNMSKSNDNLSLFVCYSIGFFFYYFMLHWKRNKLKLWQQAMTMPIQINQLRRSVERHSYAGP